MMIMMIDCVLNLLILAYFIEIGWHSVCVCQGSVKNLPQATAAH